MLLATVLSAALVASPQAVDAFAAQHRLPVAVAHRGSLSRGAAPLSSPLFFATVAAGESVAAADGARTTAAAAVAMPDENESDSETESPAAATVREYFACWNRRDMAGAVSSLFAGECTYEETLYAGAFAGNAAVRAHLVRVAAAVPGSFRFVVGEIADGGAADSGGAIGVQWHVEAGESGKPLPFTRGSSVYRYVGQDGGGGPSRIVPGFDVPEPAVKSGGASLALLSLVSKLLAGGQLGRARLATAGAWGLYVWGLFLSDQLPLPPLLQP